MRFTRRLVGRLAAGRIAQRKYHVRLAVLIPFVFSGFASLASLVSFRITDWAILSNRDPFWLAVATASGFFLLTFSLGSIITRIILQPMQRLLRVAEKSPALSSEAPPDAVAPPNELDRYMQTFDRISELLSKSEAIEQFPGIVGQSKKMRAIFSMILRVAPSDFTVLILGESGTGKELIASSIVKHSDRHNKPFVRINCAAIPQGLIESELFGHEKGAFTGAVNRKSGKFEQADGGTIFLDEIGDMPLETQAKVLRALQEKEFQRVGGSDVINADVRIIAATNKNLEAMVRDGLFREDLYFRLLVFTLMLPPLRERREDIPLLVDMFSQALAKSAEFTPEAMKQLIAYDWPGNIRELKHVVASCALLARDGLVEPADLPPRLQSTHLADGVGLRLPSDASLDEFLDDIEKMILVQVLEENGGIQARAADRLGIKERSLWHRVRKFDIDIKEIKGRTRKTS